MRKIIPLCITLFTILTTSYGQAPSFSPLKEIDFFIGGCLTLEAHAYTSSESSPVQYIWQKDGVIIPGAKSATYSIPETKLSDAGTYTIIAHNFWGQIQTNIILRISEFDKVVEIDRPLTGKTFTPGEFLEYEGHSFEREGWSPPYQIWSLEYHNNGVITSVPADPHTESSGSVSWRGYFIIPDTEPAPNAFYRVIVTGFGAKCRKGSDYVDVYWSGKRYTDYPLISEEPKSLTVTEGEAATFKVIAGSVKDYQWRFNGVPIAGANGATYSIKNVKQEHAGSYDVLLSNPNGNNVSDPASLTVNRRTTSIITLKTNPENLSITLDGQVINTPQAVSSNIGSSRSIAPVTPQTAGGVTYAFSNWAHGGSPTQIINTPSDSTLYTINYSSPLVGKWRTTEVGTVDLQGSATFNNGIFTIAGSGRDIWEDVDAFRFVYQSVDGDVDFSARVMSLTRTHGWAKAGIMIRNSTDRSSKHVMTVVTPANGVSFQHRSQPNGMTSASTFSASSPQWVRLIRRGNVFTSYTSNDGSTWDIIGAPVTLTMNSRVYIGMVVTSHNPVALCAATFTNVAVSTPVTSASLDDMMIVNDNLGFDIYPNPADGDNLNLRLYDNIPLEKVQITSILGQVLHEETFDKVPAKTVIVDLKKIPPGAYLIKLSDRLGVRTKSFIKE